MTDLERIKAEIERRMKALEKRCNLQECAVHYELGDLLSFINSLQAERFPSSTEMLAEWDKCEEMLKEKDLRGDPMRYAYHAFLDGMLKGLGFRKETPELTKEEQIAMLQMEYEKGVADTLTKQTEPKNATTSAKSNTTSEENATTSKVVEIDHFDTIPAEVGYFNQLGSLSILPERALRHYGIKEGDKVEIIIRKAKEDNK